MTDTSAIVERRKHKRYIVSKGAFVAIRPPDTGVGRIIDISIAGLTFDYVTMQKPMIRATELEIFVTNSSFRMYEVPCKSVWDLTTYDIPTIPLHKRQCGVEFGKLTPCQKARYGLRSIVNGY